ncbi:RimK family alpha-L-glutamate ligase [Actinoplanes sp. TFC3]|uniref:ATP-grasp domain-containing protein n=1 Tax=Actinoplanes sp. TFC3 TaxID=1710355 RepID=UPI00082B70B7|nr:hypothetical protein [Actinoplanes sp. TFC3]
MSYDVGLVTTGVPHLAAADHDLPGLLHALAEAGFTANAPVWNDPAVDWADYRLIVMRSPWDYPERHGEFMAWLDRVSGVTTVLNAPELIRWNIDKRYLDELSDRGVPCVPYEFCETTTEAGAALSGLSGRVVVKPSVSAGARDTGLFEPGDPAALALAERIVAGGKTVMVQPAVASVVTNGENGLFFFGGSYAYAIHKGPILALGGGYSGGEYTEDISRAEPTTTEIDLGHRAVAAVTDIFGEAPLYARVDIALTAEGPALLEMEVFEPSYFVEVVPQAAEFFVRALGTPHHRNEGAAE